MSKKPPRVIIPRTTLDIQRDEMAHFLRVGFLAGMTSIRRDISPAEIIKAITTGKWDKLREDIEGTITDKLDPLLGKAVTSTAKKTAEAMPEVPNSARIGPANPRVRDYIDSRTKVLADTTHEGVLQAAKASGVRSTLITTREKGLGGAIDKMVTKSLNVGMTLDERAAMIRGSIGLNAPQAQALVNYRNKQVADGVTGSKLLARVAGYEDKMLDYRAEMIARQEVRNAQNVAQLTVWQQAADDEFIPKESKKVWHCEQKPCEEWCRNMRGVGVALDEPWVVRNTKTGEERYVDICSDVHPGCQCSQSIDTSGRA